MKRDHCHRSAAASTGALVLCLLLVACAERASAPDAAAASSTPASAPAADASDSASDGGIGAAVAADVGSDDKTAAASPQAADADAALDPAALIGSRMPPYPDGLSEIVGSCVPGADGLDHICDYALAVLGRGERGTDRAQGLYLVGQRNTDSGAEQPVWDITDALPMPAADGYELQLVGCRIDGQPAPGLVALIRHAGGEEYGADIAWARRYDTASGRFVDVGQARIDCVDTTLGV